MLKNRPTYFFLLIKFYRGKEIIVFPFSVLASKVYQSLSLSRVILPKHAFFNKVNDNELLFCI